MTALPPPGAFEARPVSAVGLEDYFARVRSFEADRLRSARRAMWGGLAVGAVGAAIGLAGVVAVAGLTPLKSVEPLVFRVDNVTGAVERVFDLQGGALAATEAVQRYFLWRYVQSRESFSDAEEKARFEEVILLSAPPVQEEVARETKASNPSSPRARLGRDGIAGVRWLSTSFLGPRLAQVRFLKTERKAGAPPAAKRLVATIAYEFAQGAIPATALIVNPLGFLVTRYEVSEEATP